MRHVHTILAAAIVGNLLLALAAGVLLRRGIVLPVLRLAHGVERIGAGDLFHVVPPGSDDEIGTLAVAFNEMTARRASAERAAAANELARENERLLERGRAKDDLLGLMSHELRTPLAVVMAYAEDLRDGGLDGLDDEQREALDVIDRNAAQPAALVDDLLEVARGRITRAGYRALAAGDGDEAMALIRTHHPDLCVLDIAMPGLSGLEITEQIRTTPELAETLSIFLTALAGTAESPPGSPRARTTT